MPTTRSSSKKLKSITGAVSPVTPAATTLRRSSRLLQSNSNTLNRHSSVDVRQNAYNTRDCPKSSIIPARRSRRLTLDCPKSSTGPARRSQRLLQSKTHSGRRCSLGACENGHNMLYRTNTHKAITDVVATPTTIRRSQRLMPSKTGDLGRCSSGARKNSQNTLERPKIITGPDTTTSTVLRRSQRLLQSKTDRTNGFSSDGNTQQGFSLPKELSVKKFGNSISHAKLEVVPARLNFGDVQIVKCNDDIGNVGGSLERRITRNSSASVDAQNRGGKPKLRVTDNDIGVRRERDSMPSPSLAVKSGKSIQKDDDVSKRCVGYLEGTGRKSDSELVAGQEKRCLRGISNCNKGTGVKRKQKESDDVVQGTGRGWTKEQEKALQRAYFAAKPTPNFWKKVSKLVPGKSAQECFDKFDSENLTPSVPQPRSRSKQKTLSPQFEIPLSESEPKRKRPCRRKSHVNQKMVRELMRRHSHVEPDNKADFFRVLEPSVNPVPEALPKSPLLSTPSGITEKGSSSNCRSQSLSTQNKSKSRFSGKSGIPIASPPVLKPVKNMALHDKYVDQLHAREAKRKLASKACNRRSALLPQGGVTEPLLKNRDVVRDAKESLISDARDVINKFRDSEIHMESCYDSEVGYDDEDDEDEENAL